jgi:hypothetical protein
MTCLGPHSLKVALIAQPTQEPPTLPSQGDGGQVVLDTPEATGDGVLEMVRVEEQRE